MPKYTPTQEASIEIYNSGAFNEEQKAVLQHIIEAFDPECTFAGRDEPRNGQPGPVRFGKSKVENNAKESKETKSPPAA